jgi:hypothetical protein
MKISMREVKAAIKLTTIWAVASLIVFAVLTSAIASTGAAGGSGRGYCYTVDSGPVYVDKGGCQLTTPNENNESQCYSTCFKWDGSSTSIYGCAAGAPMNWCSVSNGTLTQYKYSGNCSGTTTTGSTGCSCTNYDTVSTGSRQLTDQPINLDPDSTICS